METAELDRFWQAVEGAAQLMIGIGTRRGPHVTPELFAVHAGRIWCATSASTLKARRLSDGGQVGLLGRAGSTAIIATGRAEVLDPVRPLATLARPLEAIRAGVGFGRFLARNAPEMAGAAVDAVTGKLGIPPPRRVLLAIEPLSAQVAEVPEDAKAAVGWEVPGGRIAVLPARWQPDSRRATVRRDLFEAAGCPPRSRVALAVDEWAGFGPTGKRGVMLRGKGSAEHREDEVIVEVEVERVVSWEGVRTESAEL